MANIIGSPFFVRIFLDSVIVPPTVTHSPSFFLSSSASEHSTRDRSAARTSFNGWLERNSPSVSFSIAPRSVRSSGSAGTGRWCAPPKGEGEAGPPAAAGSGSPRSKIEPCPSSASCCAFWPEP